MWQLGYPEHASPSCLSPSVTLQGLPALFVSPVGRVHVARVDIAATQPLEIGAKRLASRNTM